MTDRIALTGARIFDGTEWLERMALVIGDGVVEGFIADNSPTDAIRTPFDGGMIVPGFIDLQVNGGGGIQFNDGPTADAIRAICEAHVPFGTTALLPTLITDTQEITDKAIASGIIASRSGQPGFLGLHLEGPHLSIARKGAHDPALIRPMSEQDLARLITARAGLPNLITTVAAETVLPAQIAALAAAGIVVSIGHSDAGYDAVKAAAEAGATCVTHLFNAQSQMGNREPGVVGAALDIGTLHAGLIADAIHVHPATIRDALKAKAGPGHIFLVSDAMAPTGSDMTEFTLNGRTILRRDGALRLEDGTLAGADLTMIDAVRTMVKIVGIPLEEALRMATVYPAAVLNASATHGHLKRGAIASFVHLSDDLSVRSTWIAGQKVHSLH